MRTSGTGTGDPRRQEGAVGIITRADTALAERNASALAAWGHETSAHIGQIPDAVRAGARDIEAFARWAERHGGIERSQLAIWHRQVRTVRDLYERTLVELAARTANMRAVDLAAGTPLADLSRRDDNANRAYALRARAAALRAVLLRAENIAVRAPGWSPWQPGMPGIAAAGQGVFGDRGPSQAWAEARRRTLGLQGAPIVLPTIAGVADGPALGWGGIAARRGHLRIPPHARFWMWGASGTARGWAAERGRVGFRRLSQAAGMARAFGAGWMFSLARKGMGTAETMDDALTAFAAERGALQLGRDFDPEVLRGGTRRQLAEQAPDPWHAVDLGALDRQQGVPHPHPMGTMVSPVQGSAAVLALRTGLEAAARDFYYTTDEMRRSMQALGPAYSPARLQALSQFSRRTGRPPEAVAAYYGAILKHVAEPQIREVAVARSTAPLGWEPVPEGRVRRDGDWRTTLWPDGPPDGPTTTGSILDDINRAAYQAGMRSRMGQFMGNVGDAAQGLSAGVGFADPRDAVGLATLFGEAGFGGERWQGLQSRAVAGIGEMHGEAETAAKIAAVRRFLGPTTVGAGEYERRVDPSTLRGALDLIETRDPRVMAAFMAYAVDKAGADDDTARTIFQRMTGLGYLDTDRVWKLRHRLPGVRSAGKGYGAEEPTEWHRPGRGEVNGRPVAYLGPNEPWRNGPMVKADARGKSIAKERAELDWVGYRMGTPLLGMATDIKEAALVAARGFDDDPSAALMSAISALPWSVRITAAGMQIGRGTRGNAVAALMLGGAEAVQGTQAAATWVSNAVGQPVAGLLTSAGVVHPVAGATVMSEFGERSKGMHYGIDLAAPEGSPVRSVLGGVVETVRDVATWRAMGARSHRALAAGAYVDVRHDDGVVTRYLHLQTPEPGLAVGQRIEAGQQIGRVGTTGTGHAGPHLHFEVLRNGAPVDPRALLGPRP